MQLVKYERQPRFRFSGSVAAADISRFDPYAVLALPREDPRALLALLHAVAEAAADGAVSTAGAEAKRSLTRRASDVREAYRDLASRFHPDAAGSSGKDRAQPRAAALCSWISPQDHFIAISAAHALVSDPHAASAYLLAAEATGAAAATGGGADAVTENAARAARGQRVAAAIRERECMAQLVETAVAAQVARQRTSGDGLFVVLALYGDGRAIARAAATTNGGAAASDPRTGALAGEPRVIDVTAALTALVDVVSGPGGHGSNVQLALPPGSKRGVEGFWDPCEGFPCTLFVRYRFLGRLHEATVADDAPLKCPLKRHALAAPVAAPPAATQPLNAPPPSTAPQQQPRQQRQQPAETTAAAAAAAVPTRQRVFGRELNSAPPTTDKASVHASSVAAAPAAALSRGDTPSAPLIVTAAPDAAGDGDDGVATYTRAVDADGHAVVVRSRGGVRGSPEARRAMALTVCAARSAPRAGGRAIGGRAAAVSGRRVASGARGGAAGAAESHRRLVELHAAAGQRGEAPAAGAGVAGSRPTTPAASHAAPDGWHWRRAATVVAAVAVGGGVGVALAYALLHASRGSQGGAAVGLSGRIVAASALAGAQPVA